jgi:hypothetical protein
MATTTIDIAGYDNEDIDRQFELRSGTAQSSEPYDLSNTDLEADIRDQHGALVLRLTSAGTDGGIVKDDPENGVFTFHIPQGVIAVVQGRSLKYDLLGITGGEIQRFWGGSVRISKGVTVP